MQFIVFLAIAGVALTAIGAGYLTNTINLSSVQQLGVGETTLDSPVTTAYVDFNIQAIHGQMGFKNVITQCIMKADSDILHYSTIICKLTDINNNVVKEGKRTIFTDLPTGVRTVIPVTDPNGLTANVKNIHDLILVVQGPRTTTTATPSNCL